MVQTRVSELIIIEIPHRGKFSTPICEDMLITINDILQHAHGKEIEIYSANEWMRYMTTKDLRYRTGTKFYS